MKLAVIALLITAASAFTGVAPAKPSTQLNAADSRRAFLTSAAGAAAAVVGASPAFAIRDYEGLGYLGGGSQVDLNNANVRAYLKMPGMYPAVAGKIVSNGPYSSVGDIYNIAGLTSREKDVLKKYESKFVALKPSADFVIDRINNGLYR
ncbi:hypothetical protein TrVE_jg8744 [Triparma verrucosa]|uniref:Photosystem II 12 kDa extrinsic protein n=2 Tax=Triparma TaxID=722752 RepID=A0A9W7AWH1_9STRA|nr:hypothetical protein TrST_g9525 [Triparma strigata]GMH81391.1 hypothetical protein TrVE_jg8744 [Triparma verrucosa]|mmetsp:Transcript_7060/g.12704  ORF Transcript_7060/g.12704 Transcript_7060/m.12704 type:complete len:150 (+) Transcript_7060:34-483(+)|eukprot:CAMPEP_0182499136 /NCGR_PEP_ID=MMETSP1321-20130603/7195_1 /TAXON_ID=91990 /ORGANISM="Bolidomonas sp., Strain RCC1657" /LENGTH=149 /DNA_ID=CAMNT_0024703283 /DNA_START=24 /DNA_END=473 /DNA_ORIENTATION=+